MNGQHIVLAGGSGFIGQSLSKALISQGYRITILTRSEPPAPNKDIRTVTWDGRSLGRWTESIEGADAIVNFTGKNVNCRLTHQNRHEIVISRVDAINVLSEAVTLCHIKPKVFIQCSAVGFYGDTPGDCTESTPAGRGILSEITQICEAAFRNCDFKDTRKVVLRLGVVLGRDGGALPLLTMLTKAFLGGAAGNGQQGLSWIHEQDLNRIIMETVRNSSLDGTFNAASPQPVTNALFMRTLRNVLLRPWSPPVPALLLRTTAFVVGFNSELILTGQRCLPARLQQADFHFEFPNLEHALRDLLSE